MMILSGRRMRRPYHQNRPIAFLLLLALAKMGFGADPTESNWFAFEPVKDSFGPSVLDCSRWVEAPTGKHGFVTVKGDRFVFEDGTPVRFCGAQMGGFSKEQLDYAVRRMRRQGINITRMHGLGEPQRPQPAGPRSTTARKASTGWTT